jgi:hypothetical protein
VGVPVCQDEVVTNPGGTGATITPTISSHQEDDILIIQAGWKGNQAPTALTGWTHWFTNTTGTASNGLGQGVWWRRVNPSETVTSPTLTLGATAVERIAICYTIRGADIDNPANTFWQRQQTVGNSTSPTPPSITTAAPNYLLLHLVSCRGNSAITEPSGYTEQQDAAVSTTIAVEGSAKTQATAATVSSQAATISSNRWVAAIIAIPSPDYCYFRSQTSTTATATSVTGTLPTGTTDADFYGRADGMIAIVKAAGSGIDITPTDAVNWTNVANLDIDTGTGSDSIEVFATEYASGRNLQFTRPTSGVISVQLLTYRNVHQTSFIGASNGRQNSGTPAPFDALDRTSTRSTMVAVIVVDADTNGVHTAPAGWTEHSDGLGIGSADQVFEDIGSTTGASWTTANAANIAGLVEIKSHAGAAPSAAEFLPRRGSFGQDARLRR